MTAIRETFEETGLLLASESATWTSGESDELPQSQSHQSLSEAALDASRESIHSGRTLFRDFLKQHALDADVKALLPFTEWITPLGFSRCVCSTHSHTMYNTPTKRLQLYTNAVTQPLPHAFLRRFPAL